VAVTRLGVQPGLRRNDPCSSPENRLDNILRPAQPANHDSG
jgi:hypothetical protein